MWVSGKSGQDHLTLETKRIAKTKDGVLLVEFEIRADAKLKFNPEWIWLTQNGIMRPIHNLALSSQELRARKGAAQTAQSLDLGEQGHAAQYHVILSGEANAYLEELASKVNDGFDSGAVTKSDVANYVLLNLPRAISEADIRAVRALHFDEKKVLGSLLRGEDDLPENLKKALRAHFGVGDREKRKPSIRAGG